MHHEVFWGFFLITQRIFSAFARTSQPLATFTVGHSGGGAEISRGCREDCPVALRELQVGFDVSL